MWKVNILKGVLFLIAALMLSTAVGILLWDGAGGVGKNPFMTATKRWGSRGFHEPCDSDIDCRKPDLFCSAEKRRCTCMEANKTLMIKMKYNELEQKCQSYATKICTIDDDDLWGLECVENAECVWDGRFSTKFGICKCKRRYLPTPKLTCKKWKGKGVKHRV